MFFLYDYSFFEQKIKPSKRAMESTKENLSAKMAIFEGFL